MSDPIPLAGYVAEEIEEAPVKKRRVRTGKTPEGEVKDDIKAFFDHIGVFKFMPSQNGRGDRAVDFLGVWRSAAIAVEAKAPGEDATDKQKEFLKQWRDRGGWGFVADSLESLMVQWSEECLSCGIKPPAICSMTGSALRTALGFPPKRVSKGDLSLSPIIRASRQPSGTSKRFTSAKSMCRSR